MSTTVKNAKKAIDAIKQDGKESGKHVFVLMDESGSMGGLEEAVTTGCNEFLHEFKDEADTKIWLAWFDDSPGEPRTRLKVSGEQASKVAPLTPADYNPRGMTPLNDAIADAIATLDDAVSGDEIVFLAIITDGAENASEHSTASIKDQLAVREEQGWGVVFIAANQDASVAADAFGLSAKGKSFRFDASHESVRFSMKSVADIAKLRTGSAAGAAGREQYESLLEDEHDKRGGRLDEQA